MDIRSLTEADAHGLILPPLPDSAASDAAALTVAGFTSIPDDDIDHIEPMLEDFYGEAGFKIRRTDITPLGVTDEGDRFVWIMVYLEERGL